jgi:hypothetical protein
MAETCRDNELYPRLLLFNNFLNSDHGLAFGFQEVNAILNRSWIQFYRLPVLYLIVTGKNDSPGKVIKGDFNCTI